MLKLPVRRQDGKGRTRNSSLIVLFIHLKYTCYQLLVQCVCPTAQEKPSSPEDRGLPRLKPAVKTRTPFVTVPASQEIPDAVYPADSEEVQQSSGSSGVPLGNRSAVFPGGAFGPEDRNYETSVFGGYPEGGQREPAEPANPNATAQCRQSKWLKYQNRAQCDLRTPNSDGGEGPDDICAEKALGMPLGVNNSAPGSAPLLTANSGLGKHCPNTSSRDWISEREPLSPRFSQTPLAEATQKVLSHLSCYSVTGDGQVCIFQQTQLAVTGTHFSGQSNCVYLTSCEILSV